MDGELSPALSPGPGDIGPWRVATRLADLHDSRRARTLPVKFYLPDISRPRGLILFSHGLGGSREGGVAWLAHWASHGFMSLALQHPGSDSALLRNNSPLALRAAFKAAMNPQELTQRAHDVRFVLERIGHDPALPDVVNTAQAIGLAGHSFGAVTVQLLAGERRSAQPPLAVDARVRAVLALSPSARQADSGPGLAQRFGQIRRPFFSITGNRDDGMGLSDITVANRELPFRHMPADGGKYLLVFAGGNHLDFAGEDSSSGGVVFRIRREPASFRPALLAASTAFWQAHLAGKAAAGHWLTTDFPARLRPDDRFEHK